MKHTNYKEVKQLAKNILKDDKQMILLTQDLAQALKTLEGTFLDDGIDEVKAFVNGLEKRLESAQASFFTIASELKDYADLLESGKG